MCLLCLSSWGQRGEETSPGETSSVRRPPADDGGGVEESTPRLSLPPVAYLYLPEPRALVFFLQVARFGELLRLPGRAGVWGAAAGRIGSVLGGLVAEVVQRGGGGGGHVLGGAVLRFDAQVEGGQVRRGGGAGLGGERTPPAGHTGNRRDKTFRLILPPPLLSRHPSDLYLSFLSTLNMIMSSPCREGRCNRTVEAEVAA